MSFVRSINKDWIKIQFRLHKSNSVQHDMCVWHCILSAYQIAWRYEKCYNDNMVLNFDPYVCLNSFKVQNIVTVWYFHKFTLTHWNFPSNYFQLFCLTSILKWIVSGVYNDFIEIFQMCDVGRNMTEDFSQKALVRRHWHWMRVWRSKSKRQLGGRQKHWVTETLNDWVTGWMSH